MVAAGLVADAYPELELRASVKDGASGSADREQLRILQEHTRQLRVHMEGETEEDEVETQRSAAYQPQDTEHAVAEETAKGSGVEEEVHLETVEQFTDEVEEVGVSEPEFHKE